MKAEGEGTQIVGWKTMYFVSDITIITTSSSSKLFSHVLDVISNRAEQMWGRKHLMNTVKHVHIGYTHIHTLRHTHSHTQTNSHIQYTQSPI